MPLEVQEKELLRLQMKLVKLQGGRLAGRVFEGRYAAGEGGKAAAPAAVDRLRAPAT